MGGSIQQYLHWVGGGGVAFLFAGETLDLWAPDAAGKKYVGLVVLYLATYLLGLLQIMPDTGIPYIGRQVGMPIQYVMLGYHLVLVYRNYPRVREEGFAGNGVC